LKDSLAESCQQHAHPIAISQGVKKAPKQKATSGRCEHETNLKQQEIKRKKISEEKCRIKYEKNTQ